MTAEPTRLLDKYSIQLRLRYINVGILFVACIQPFRSQAQATEYVSNGSFESGATPTCWGHGKFATNWKTQNLPTTSSIFHSPDLFDNTINFPAPGCSPPFGLAGGFTKLAMGAASGNRYMGIGAYELIEQEIGQVLIADSVVSGESLKEPKS